MAKIIRYDGNLVPFAKNATATNRTIFGGVAQSDDLTDNIDDGDYKLGWEVVGPSDKPTIEDFSGAMFTNAQLSAYLHQMGVAEWNAGQEYQVGSISNRSGAIYSCKTADHVSATPPESDPVNWDSAIPADLLNTVRVDVASAATVDLGVDAPDTRNINITGTATIGEFNVLAGQLYFVRFDAAATLTNSASIVTQSGNDILAASGDTCIIRATATDVVEVLCYARPSVSSVTNSGTNANGRFRIWSDGVIEQWGTASLTAGVILVVPLPISMTTSTDFALATGSSTSGVEAEVSVISKSTADINVLSDQTQNADWYVLGV